MDIKIINIATANPKMTLPQSKSLNILRKEKKLSRRENILYERFLLDKGIKERSFAVGNIKDFFTEDPDQLIKRFQKEGARLSVASLKSCLRQSSLTENDISCIIVSTCTGYLCPGLTSYIIEKAGLRPDIFASDIVGMGCGGALPAIRSAYNFLSSRGESSAMVTSTEISSSAIFWEDDPGLILSNSIFGDGSASCILTNKKGIDGLKIVDFASRILPHHRDILRFRTESARLKNVIKSVVPEVVASLVKDIVREILERNKLKQGDIRFWAFHPGGRKILDKIQEAMHFKAGVLNYSREVLRRHGNMSSPTVLYVLKDIVQSKMLKKGDPVIMASFGAGFSGYAALLNWSGS